MAEVNNNAFNAKLIYVLVATLLAWGLANGALGCVRNSILKYEALKNVASGCCGTLQCYNWGKGEIPPERATCVLKYLSVLIENKCELHATCQREPDADARHAILCDLETCIENGPLTCMWAFYLYLPVLVVGFLIMMFL